MMIAATEDESAAVCHRPAVNRQGDSFCLGSHRTSPPQVSTQGISVVSGTTSKRPELSFSAVRQWSTLWIAARSVWFWSCGSLCVRLVWLGVLTNLQTSTIDHERWCMISGGEGAVDALWYATPDLRSDKEVEFVVVEMRLPMRVQK